MHLGIVLGLGPPAGPVGAASQTDPVAPPATPYLQNFPATSGVNSDFYGPNAGGAIKLDADTGAFEAATYVDIQGTDHYNFLRDGIVLDRPTGSQDVLVLGQSRLGPNAQGTAVGILTMSLDLSQVYDRWDCGETSNTAQDGQPALVHYQDSVWAAFTVQAAIDTTGSAGGADPTHNGGTHERLVVCRFSIDPITNVITLVNHTYIQDQTGTGGMFCETHGIAINSRGNVLVAGEAFQGGGTYGSLPGLSAASYNSTTPTGRVGIIVELTPDLGTFVYSSYFGDSSGGDAYFDGIDTFRDGRYCMAMVDAGGSVPVTDGSSRAGAGDAGMLVVFDGNHNLVYSSYVTDGTSGDEPLRRAIFDTDGNIYAGGWSTVAGDPVATLWRFAYTDGAFSRDTVSDALFESPPVSSLATLTTKLTMEVKATWGMEVNTNLFRYPVDAADARAQITHAAAGTPETMWIWGYLNAAANSGANSIKTGEEYTFRLMWDGDREECRVYALGGDAGTPASYYATDTLIATNDIAPSQDAIGTPMPWAFDEDFAISIFSGTGYSITNCEYIKVWYTVETDWSTPTAAPPVLITSNNCNTHSWKRSDTDEFTVTEGAYALDWTLTFPTAGGAGQIRDIAFLGSSVYVTGGTTAPDTAPDHDYTETGGTGGSSPDKLQGFAAKVSDAGVREWLTLWGGTTNYDRSYAIEVHDGSVYSFGRLGDRLFVQPAPGGTPTYVDHAVASTTTTALTPTLPTHASGDMLVMAIFSDTGAVSAPTISGWTRQAVAATSAGGLYTELMVYTKIAGGAEVAPNITFNVAPDSAYLALVTSVTDATTVHRTATATSSATSDLPTFNAPGVTTAVDNALIMMFMCTHRNNDTMTSSPADSITDYLDPGDASPGTQASAYAGYFTQLLAGGISSKPITASNGSGHYRPTAVTLAII